MIVPIAAYADEYDDQAFYVLDKFTGEIMQEDAALMDTVTIDSECFYSKSDAFFHYPVPGIADAEILSTAFDGMVTRNGVTIKSGPQTRFTVYKDGNLYSDIVNNECSLTETGQYKVFLDNENIFSFTIVGAVTGAITGYYLPTGFTITSATKDGAPVTYTYSGINMGSEGLYDIKYQCDATGMAYTLTTQIDLTPPEIILDGVDEKGIANGPVTIYTTEENVNLALSYEGKPVQFSQVVKQSGDYTIIATDIAGNISNHSFTIRMYLNISAWFAIAFLVLAVGGVIAYVIYSRKHLKIC